MLGHKDSEIRDGTGVQNQDVESISGEILVVLFVYREVFLSGFTISLRIAFK